MFISFKSNSFQGAALSLNKNDKKLAVPDLLNSNPTDKLELKSKSAVTAGINSINVKQTPLDDNQYRAVLAKAVGCKVENLKSIIGVQEFNTILKNLKPEHFIVGKDMENVKNGITRVNLHTHTTDSDGKATIESLLDQSVEYADKIAKTDSNSLIPPFTLALTNHDSVEDSKKAIKIIAANPEKYKNLRFVPGIEFSSKFIDDTTLFKPGTKLEMETIGYCINPFDEKLNEFVKGRHKANILYAKNLFEDVNTWMKTFKFDIEKIKQDNVYLKMEGSPAFPEELLKSVKESFEKEVKDVSKKHIDNAGDPRLTASTPEVKEIADLLKQTGCGELGLAHPGRIEKLYSSLASVKMAGEKGMALFLDKIKNSGVAVIEAEYQYPPDYKSDYSSKESFDSSIKNIRETCDSLDLLKAGGLDTHSVNLFLNKDPKPKK